ncbi:MAG: hypothetical protein EXR66_07200 [Dehalococcoidia bacterium]|nr:hypothetical protein [Dehalococcoidia bacterium]
MTPEDARSVDERPPPRVVGRQNLDQAATLLLSEGVHIRAIQERLGHSDVRLTLAVYSHVLPTLQREAAGKLEVALGAR